MVLLAAQGNVFSNGLSEWEIKGRGFVLASRAFFPYGWCYLLRKAMYFANGLSEWEIKCFFSVLGWSLGGGSLLLRVCSSFHWIPIKRGS